MTTGPGIFGLKTLARSYVNGCGRWMRNPLGRPMWQMNSLDLSRAGGIGDVLMCTPALREVKRLNQNCVIRFYTGFPSLVRGLPWIDEVLPFEARPLDDLYLGYD